MGEEGRVADRGARIGTRWIDLREPEVDTDAFGQEADGEVVVSLKVFPRTRRPEQREQFRAHEIAHGVQGHVPRHDGQLGELTFITLTKEALPVWAKQRRHASI